MVLVLVNLPLELVGLPLVQMPDNAKHYYQ